MKLEKLYQLSQEERINLLKEINGFDPNLNVVDENLFEHLIENYVTTFEVPVGIVPNVLVNDKLYHVPVATEEPSVIAGCSKANKIIAKSGGFKTKVLSKMMMGQIVFSDVKDFDELKAAIPKLSPEMVKIGAECNPTLHQLGGGVKKFGLATFAHNFACLYIMIDVVDAMGANSVNTILEAIAKLLEEKLNLEVLMAILSNNADCLVEVTCQINPQDLKSPLLAEKVAKASYYATLDPNRAVTHNKGIMNTVSGIALATGNDTRGLEAAAHSFASHRGSYQPLSSWTIDDNGILEGKLLMPIVVGTVGGAIGVLPKAQFALKMLNLTDAKELMMIMGACGLASNFAALYALVDEGIQKGHMKLHNRSKNIV